MKIVIVGAGKLGMKICTVLLGGSHSVTIIDTNEDLLQKINSQVDVMTVNANAKETRVLKDLHIESYDFLIAVTGDDETNLVISAFAKRLGCSKVITRISDPEHMQQINFIKDTFNIDHVVNPDQAITTEIYKYLAEKYSLSNGIFSSGRISIVEFPSKKYPKLIGMRVGSETRSVLADMLIVAISRNGKVIIPQGGETISPNDDLYVVGERDSILKVNAKVHENGKYTDLQKVMIIGGGKTGFYLAHMLSEFGASVKIIERNKERCYYLSSHLDDDVMVLHGDATDLSLLEEENIDSMDAVVTATGFDEDNLLLALAVKQRGIEDVIAKVSKTSYANIISQMGIDMALNPLDIITSDIMHFIQGSNKIISSQIIEGQAELMEIIATPHMNILYTPISELDLHEGIIIAAINRGTQVIIPDDDTKIEEDDRVLMLSLLSDRDVTESLLKDTGTLGFLTSGR